MEGHLIVVQKVSPGDEVRARKILRHSLPGRCIVADVKPLVVRMGDDILDAQDITIEGHEGWFNSTLFELQEMRISHEALDVLERLKALRRAAV